MKNINKRVSEIIGRLDDIIYYVYIQNYYKASLGFQKIMSEIINLPGISEEIKDYNSEIYNGINSIMKAMESSDMILMADLLKEIIIPRLQLLLNIEEGNITKDYAIECTSSGYYTIKDLNNNIYLHSNTNPMEEARLFIKGYFDPSVTKYIVWGIGLGYHVKRLLEESNNAIDIEVYYDDKKLYNLGCEYGAIEDTLPNVKYYHDFDGLKFMKAITLKDSGILLHYPSIKTIRNNDLREKMEKLYMGWNGTMQFRKDLEINFRRNNKVINNNVDQILSVFKGQEVYIVAAGPSLDASIDVLRNKDENALIMSVTTIYRKLCELGIIPDYTVVMDSQEVTLRQVENLKNHTVPMIIGSTTYWEIADTYKGKKYISYQKDYKLSEEEAVQKGNNIYPTGGSVTTLALSILLKAGAKRINLIGADMAYLDGMSHAENVNDRKIRDNNNLEKVKSVTGNVVYTEKKLYSYLKWIEREIVKYTDIKVYNYSKTGAWISGTYNPYTEEKYK